jgi:hypothetical protein
VVVEPVVYLILPVEEVHFSHEYSVQSLEMEELVEVQLFD